MEDAELSDIDKKYQDKNPWPKKRVDTLVEHYEIGGHLTLPITIDAFESRIVNGQIREFGFGLLGSLDDCDLGCTVSARIEFLMKEEERSLAHKTALHAPALQSEWCFEHNNFLGQVSFDGRWSGGEKGEWMPTLDWFLRLDFRHIEAIRQSVATATKDNPVAIVGASLTEGRLGCTDPLDGGGATSPILNICSLQILTNKIFNSESLGANVYWR
jgi:hypothetical protein